MIIAVIVFVVLLVIVGNRLMPELTDPSIKITDDMDMSDLL